MELSDSKRKIIEVSVDLFCRYGYEATSVGQIAEAVGIRTPSLYSHFKGKQEIFDTMIDYLSEEYEQRSPLALSGQAHGEDKSFELSSFTPEKYAEKLCCQIRTVTQDPIIKKTRQLLTIEQFRNSALSAELEKRQYTDVFAFNKGVISRLIEGGVLIDGDADVMALQLMSPITVEMQRVDRNPDLEQEAEELVRRHVLQFFRLYAKK